MSSDLFTNEMYRLVPDPLFSVPSCTTGFLSNPEGGRGLSLLCKITSLPCHCHISPSGLIAPRSGALVACMRVKPDKSCFVSRCSVICNQTMMMGWFECSSAAVIAAPSLLLYHVARPVLLSGQCCRGQPEAFPIKQLREEHDGRERQS